MIPKKDTPPLLTDNSLLLFKNDFRINPKLAYFLLLFLLITFFIYVTTVSVSAKSKPELMLANIYHNGIALDQYWVSEKYDGVRVLWDGDRLVSRGGNTYFAPSWFTKNFPEDKLDGELWIARQQFELTISTVRDHIPDSEAWKKVNFMVFDMPELDVVFDKRLTHLKKTIKDSNVAWLKTVKQWKVKDHKALLNQLDVITQQGAEGLMLHRGNSFYKGKRSGDLLKVKSYQDAEAVVIEHLSGKGKYRNMLGAIVVEMPNKKRFKIGTGFSDEERSNPPKVGQIVTYQYHGKTKNGIPRFASFLRIRELEK